jgi:hypothetical protein
MKPAALAALALVAALAGQARAADAPSPPAGWEVPPPLASATPDKAAKKKKAKAAACCLYDDLCCARQSELDSIRTNRMAKAFDVRFSELNALVEKRAPEGGTIEGLPALRVLDGRGRSYPWSDGPLSEVRVLPKGRFGFISLGDKTEYVWADKERQANGYGVIYSYDWQKIAPDKGRAGMTGDVEFTSYDEAPEGRIAIDVVRGKLAGTPEIQGASWSHVEAVPVAGHVLHAYRGEGTVTFLLPLVDLGFESLDAKVAGGWEPASRFSSGNSPSTTYTFPAAPTRSALGTCTLNDWQVARWFARPKGAEKTKRTLRMVLAASQTNAEPEPRLRVVFFDD